MKHTCINIKIKIGWSVGAMVVGLFQCGGVLLIWIIVWQEPIVHAVAAGVAASFLLFPCFW